MGGTAGIRSPAPLAKGGYFYARAASVASEDDIIEKKKVLYHNTHLLLTAVTWISAMLIPLWRRTPWPAIKK